MPNDAARHAIPRPAGLVLAPFRALRYDPARVDLASVLAPPYDVIDDDERRELAQRSEHNVVRLILPEADDAGDADRYAAARRTLDAWRTAGLLVPDARPALYVYEMRTGEHVQRGLLGALGLTPAEDEIVLPHENTMAGPVQDRLALMTAVEGDLEPIFLVYDGGGAASKLVADPPGDPVATATTPDGVTHSLWAVDAADVLAEVAADLHSRRAVIADGHHRYATFLRYQEQRHAAGDGPGPWDLGLALLVDGSAYGPQVHPIHRVVPGLRADDAAARAAAGFSVEELTGTVDGAVAALADAGRTGPAFLVTDGDRHWLLRDPDLNAVDAAMPPERSAAWRRLDVTVAHAFLIRRLWRLEDTEDVVDFRHDVASAVAAARAAGGTALLLNPTPVADVAAVAAAGDRMPRKSTLFVPKPATGVAIRAFADA